MNAMPDFSDDFDRVDHVASASAPARARGSQDARSGGAEDPLAPRWAALHRAAGALAALTGSSVPGTERHASLYPVAIPASRDQSIEAVLGDLCSMLETGLYAVLQAREHGADGKIAARALLKRFERERGRLVGHTR
ncbi:MAG: hypothetical protein CL820_10670 [Croceicoccus sp.]|nr:hypothetical protein [Croceicoccus sp.]MAL26339.1 hypothetical protein [Croceicoccus sp.]|tara:strand:- start:149156 stop:149566 length:411 start_codon:yes stop_codon:yes gene_type:complete